MYCFSRGFWYTGLKMARKIVLKLATAVINSVVQ